MKKQKKMVEPPQTINNIINNNIVNGNTTTSTIRSTSSSKKKGKKVITVKKEVSDTEMNTQVTAALAAAEGKSRDGGVDGTELSFPVAAVAAEMVVDDGVVYGTDDWRTWLRPGALVDEQMSWGSVWYEVDANYSCHAFYGDVLEEDDIWDLRSTKHNVPPQR